MIVVCGKEALDAERLGNLCREKPLEEVYALPWVTTEANLLGVLEERSGKPNRLFPCRRNTDPFVGESQVFDEALEGDAFGRMADLVSKETPVLNDVMSCPCESAFYGRVLTKKTTAHEAVFLVRCQSVSSYFPSEPISAKMYAALTVPVEFKNTERFAKVAAYNEEKVRVLVSSDFIEGTTTFLRFYQLMCGMDFVATVDRSFVDGSKTPLFRYDKGYRSFE